MPAAPGSLHAIKAVSQFPLCTWCLLPPPRGLELSSENVLPLGTEQEDYVLSPAAVLVEKNVDKIGLVHFVKCKYSSNSLQVFRELFLFHFPLKAELVGSTFLHTSTLNGI